MGLGVKLNFCNFIAFPITFGIGVDYAVNIMARYRARAGINVSEADPVDGRRRRPVLAHDDRRVQLAPGRRRIVGLFLFGVAAVLGEIACVTTATIVSELALVLCARATRRWSTDSTMSSFEARVNASEQNADRLGGVRQ